MKVFDKLIRVSKKSFAEKLFDVDVSKLSKKELKKVQPFLPTEDEQAFAEVYRSTMPELARLQRKMSVCLDVEVTELEEEKISFLYGRHTYTLLDPANSYLMCQALEKKQASETLNLTAVKALAEQKCVLKDGEPVIDLKTGFKIDELLLIEKVATEFFFQIFLV